MLFAALLWLGINYRKIHSNSVGYKTDYEMFSMDFEEFLWAKGYSDIYIEDILEHMYSGNPFSDTELSVYKKLFLEYCVLGGMPAVIRLYIETNTFSDTLEITNSSQKISTHLLTVLIISVILQLEQRKGNKREQRNKFYEIPDNLSSKETR